MTAQAGGSSPASSCCGGEGGDESGNVELEGVRLPDPTGGDRLAATPGRVGGRRPDRPVRPSGQRHWRRPRRSRRGRTVSSRPTHSRPRRAVTGARRSHQAALRGMVGWRARRTPGAARVSDVAADRPVACVACASASRTTTSWAAASAHAAESPAMPPPTTAARVRPINALRRSPMRASDRQLPACPGTQRPLAWPETAPTTCASR